MLNDKELKQLKNLKESSESAFKSGNYIKAKSLLKQMLNMIKDEDKLFTSTKAQTYYNLGCCELKLKSRDYSGKQKEYFKKAIELGNGAVPDAYYNYGVALYKEGELRLAYHYMNCYMAITGEEDSGALRVEEDMVKDIIYGGEW